jgi:hypothetical protein
MTASMTLPRGIVGRMGFYRLFVVGVLVACLGVPLVMWVVHMRRVVVLRSLGAYIESRVSFASDRSRFDEAYLGIEYVGFSGKGISDEDLLRIPWIGRYKGLSLSNTEVTDAGIAGLKFSGRVTIVDVAFTQVGTSGAEYILRNAPALDILILEGCPLSKEEIAVLRAKYSRVTIVVGRGSETEAGVNE